MKPGLIEDSMVLRHHAEGLTSESDRPNLASSYSFGALIELSVTNYHALRVISN